MIIKSSSKIVLLLLLTIFYVSGKTFNESYCQQNGNQEAILLKEVKESYDLNISLQQLLSGEELPILIYRYGYGMCSSCIKSDLEILKDLQSQIGSEKILILPMCSYCDRKNKIAIDNELKNFRYKILTEEEWIIPDDIDGFKRRYFTLITDYNEISKVYFPRGVAQDSVKEYCSEIMSLIKI